MTSDELNLDALQTQGRWQLRVQRAGWRHRLVSLSKACLWAWLLAMLLLAVWYGACLMWGADWDNWGCYDILGVTAEQFTWFNLRLMIIWKLTSVLVFLVPGLALRLAAGPAD
jgi:hypothetical protein